VTGALDEYGALRLGIACLAGTAAGVAKGFNVDLALRKSLNRAPTPNIALVRAMTFSRKTMSAV